jgi:hypothetical protein
MAGSRRWRKTIRVISIGIVAYIDMRMERVLRWIERDLRQRDGETERERGVSQFRLVQSIYKVSARVVHSHGVDME